MDDAEKKNCAIGTYEPTHRLYMVLIYTYVYVYVLNSWKLCVHLFSNTQNSALAQFQGEYHAAKCTSLYLIHYASSMHMHFMFAMNNT